ncbi:hypothetical protein IVB30_17610 [Bradyrhizobium sp. 200]|uniref:DUF4238 domain-containing protein n=1 Tax=Bradyrhizobium sp. 200 TaxID=2782665 RepID=UPI001FFEE5F2|nr:DUF4238 domain-containing protein [Bradyrhizobium sp. 200]UPJ52972.1 hypothetical protein IVB30_17610 [Bradyrhizobium sp. 200]
MAGKRQHYVPRLLQRGFLDDPSDEAERTWLHRRGVDAKLVGIRDVGVEDWFYSRRSLDGTPTLDDAITAIERDLGTSVGALRASAPGSSIDAVEAARTVVHLVMRTGHLRGVISTGMTSLTNEIGSLFTDPMRLGAMIGLTGPALASVVLDTIRDKAAELVPTGIPAAFSERLMAFELRELGERLVEQAVAMLGPIFPQLFSGLAGKVRDAHNSILATSPESNGWVTALAAFEWTVEAGVDLILPDAVALAREDDGPLMPLLFTKARDLRAVVMPVSPDRMLVGRPVGSAPINLDRFNTQAAASCEAFFISARPFNGDKLNALIGSALANAIENTISTAIREAEQVRTTAGLVIAPAKTHAITQQGFSFSVRLADFGDDVLAKEFAAVLDGVVGALIPSLPLHELDGFTLAVDYHDALAALDRGDPNLPRVTSRVLGYGLGVASPVAVIRDGVRKKHLVVSAVLAEMWLSPDADVRAAGLHTLVNMLAGIAHWTRYAAKQETGFTPGAMERELHSAVAAAPAHYWSARQAAFVKPDQGRVYAELVLDSLDFAEREIAKERARIPDKGGVGYTTMRALECVSAILSHAADWLGHHDGIAEGQTFAGIDLRARLKARGLDRWIELFGRDLAACYGPDDALNFELVTRLSPHVERLFWSLGIYCWPEENHVRCLVTDQFFLPPDLP